MTQAQAQANEGVAIPLEGQAFANVPAEGAQAPEGSQEAGEWEALASEFTAEDSEGLPQDQGAQEGAEPAQGEETPAAQGPEPATPVEPEPEGEPEPEPEVAAQESEETSQDIPQVPEEPEAPEPTPEDLQAQREQARRELAERFRLSDEQAEALLMNPNEVLPQLVADVFLDVYDQVVGAIQAKLPDVVAGILEQQRVLNEERESFFREWPELAKEEYQPVIQRIKEAYWQMNPKASREQAIKEIGAQAWVALRLPLDGLLKRAGAADEALGKEGAQEAQNPPPRQPAATGGATYEPPKERPKNEYELLAEELLAEDAL